MYRWPIHEKDDLKLEEELREGKGKPALGREEGRCEEGTAVSVVRPSTEVVGGPNWTRSRKGSYVGRPDGHALQISGLRSQRWLE